MQSAPRAWTENVQNAKMKQLKQQKRKNTTNEKHGQSSSKRHIDAVKNGNLPIRTHADQSNPFLILKLVGEERVSVWPRTPLGWLGRRRPLVQSSLVDVRRMLLGLPQSPHPVSDFPGEKSITDWVFRELASHGYDTRTPQMPKGRRLV